MVDKEHIIEIVSDPEELPTDVKKRFYRISALTDGDKERIAGLMNKLDELLSKADDTQVINSIVDLKAKLTQISIYMSRLEEKIDAIPLDRSSQKIDYAKDEIKDYLAILSDEIQATKKSFLSKLEELRLSMGVFDSSAFYDVRNEIKAAISDAGNKIKESAKEVGDDIRTDVSDIVEGARTSLSNINENFKQSVSDISTRFYEIETSISNKIETLKTVMGQSSENIDNTLTALYVIRDVINKSSENIEGFADNLRDVSLAVSKKLDNLSDFVVSVDSAREQLETNVKSLEETRSDIVDFVKNVDKKTDDVLNVVISKATELGKLKDSIKEDAQILDKNVKDMAGTNAKLQDNMTLLDDLRTTHKKIEKEIKGAGKKISKVTKSMNDNDASLKKTIGSLKATERAARKKELINSQVLNELKRFNIHLSKLDEAEFFFRILEIKKRLKKYKRLPRWAADRRNTLLKSIVLFELEITDITVIYALLKADASFSELRKITGISEKNLKASLNKLIEEKRVRKYRKGRFFAYSIIA